MTSSYSKHHLSLCIYKNGMPLSADTKHRFLPPLFKNKKVISFIYFPFSIAFFCCCSCPALRFKSQKKKTNAKREESGGRNAVVLNATHQTRSRANEERKGEPASHSGAVRRTSVSIDQAKGKVREPAWHSCRSLRQHCCERRTRHTATHLLSLPPLDESDSFA